MARLVISTPTVSDAIGAQFLGLSEHLCQLGHDVHLVEFREPGGPLPRHRAGERLTVCRWPSSKGTTASDAAFFVRLLRSVRPDCVVGQLESTSWTMLLSKLVGIPVRVAWSHMLMRTFDIDGARRSLPLRIRRRTVVYRCATNVVSASSAGVDDLTRVFRVDPRKCHVLRYGLEDPHAESSIDDDRSEIATVGRLVGTKDHATLIRAVAELVGRRGLTCRLTIIGDGPLRKELEELATELDVRGSIDFVGSVGHAEAVARMRKATVYVHPARWDNNPFAVIEAMSCGLPIVATAVGGVGEMINDGRDGVLVDAGDPSAMARVLSELLIDRDRREALGSAARERFLQEYELSRFVARTSDFLLGEIDRASKSGRVKRTFR
jgi:glycosyltransferase involved in cell wall biosynthesis